MFNGWGGCNLPAFRVGRPAKVVTKLMLACSILSKSVHVAYSCRHYAGRCWVESDFSND